MVTFEGGELFFIPTSRSNTMLYAPLLRKLFLISDGLAELISQSGFDSDCDDINYLKKSLLEGLKRKIVPEPPVDNSDLHLSLELTRDCTLSCIYCHAEAGRKESMNPELLETAVEYAFRTSVERNCKSVIVSFVAGGEPTINWPLFRSSVKKINEAGKKHNLPFRLSITTNGYYNELERKYLVEHFGNINLSLDGPEDIQNKHRPTRDGKKSFPDVIDSGRYFASHSNSFAVRVTVTDYNVRRMEEIISFFDDELGNKADVVFEPCFPVGRAREMHLASPPSQELFLVNYLAAKEKGTELGIKVTCSSDNTDRVISTYCNSLARPSFVVTTKGIVTACEGDAEGTIYNYGRFEQGVFRYDERGVAKIAELTTTLPEKCNQCFVKYHCAGDCPTTRITGQDLCIIRKGIAQYNLGKILS
ncbi:radical SAM protein [Candidatus Woesearchaeota archaeon]|nr:radical SAM protein [Candidatus Woesearchaeota archaeon]